MGVVNKIDYLNAILKNKSLELQFDQIELDDKEIIDEDTHDYSQDYLTFEALEDGAFSFTENIKYSYNNSEWIQLNAGTNTCNINKGDIIRIKNDDAEYISCSITKSLTFLAYGSFDKSPSLLALNKSITFTLPFSALIFIFLVDEYSVNKS